MYKTWHVREDGMVFRGYRKNKKGEVIEHWVRPEVAARRKVYQKEADERRRQTNRADPDKRKAMNKYAADYMRSARRLRPVPHMLARIKRRAKEKGFAFSITHEDIQVPAVCPVLGIPLYVGDGGPTDNSPELDRIDNNKGYVKGNVMVVSRRANRIKNDATLDELERIASFYRYLQKCGHDL